MRHGSWVSVWCGHGEWGWRGGRTVKVGPPVGAGQGGAGEGCGGQQRARDGGIRRAVCVWGSWEGALRVCAGR